MTLRRRVICFTLSALLVLPAILTSCDTTGSSGDSKDTVTITHYTQTSEDRNYFKKLVPDFEKAYPNIKVKVEEVPYDQFDTKLQTMISGGNSPDVTSHWGQAGFIEFYNKGLLTDITPYMKEDNFNPVDIGIPENLLNIYKIDGKVYGLPLNSYVSLMIYNKDMLDKASLPYPPSDYEDTTWTYEKMMDYAKKLTIPSDDLATAQYGIDFFWSEPDMFPLYFGAKSYSDDTWTNGGRPTACYFDSESVIKAIQERADYIWKYKIQPSEAIRKGLAGENGDAFVAGKIAMSVTGAWGLASMKDANFKFGVAAVPAGGNPKVRDVLYVDPLFILKDSKHPKEAYEWIKYQLSPEVQVKAMELSGGNPPANLKAAEKYYSYFPGVDPKELENVVQGGIIYGAESYNHLIANYSQIWNIVKNETDPVIYSGKKQASEVAPELQKKVTELLNKLNEKK